MEQNRSEPIKFQKNGWTGTKSSRKIELLIKKFIFLWSFPGFRSGPHASANQIAEKSLYALSEEDKQKDKQVRQQKDGKMQKAQNRSVPPRL